jgi:hypothetical protein
MRLVGSRTILPLLPALALSCMASSPSAPERVGDAAAPTAAAEQTAAAPAPGYPSEPSDVAPEAASPESAAVRKESPDAAPPPMPSRAPTPDPDGPTTTRSQSRLDIAVPSINGGLNRDIIRRIASDHADDIRDCHGRALASMPELTGELLVELWINERGRVTNAEVTGGDVSRDLNDRVGECVIKLAMGWTFADAGGEGSFKLALDFANE